MLARVSKSFLGRAYELGLKAGVLSYRQPFPYDGWDQGFATGEHDHYEDLPSRARYGTIAAYLGALPGPLDILDIGCGTGVMRERIDDAKVKSYLGIDTSSSAIRRAQERNLPNSTFKVAPEPGRGGFDAVICNEMLYFVPDMDRFLDEAKSYLRPGGIFITSNTRYHGDFVLRRAIEKRFTLLDETQLRMPSRRLKHRVGCYQV